MTKQHDFFNVALITGAHGIRGELRVKLLSEQPERLFSCEHIHLRTAEDQNLGQRSCHFRGSLKSPIVALEGISTRTEAETLRGHYLAMLRSELGDLPKDRYYVRDLLGMRVFVEGRGEVGTIRDVLNYASSDLLVVKRPGKKDFLAPILKETLFEVNLESRTLRIDLPEGLWEVYED